VVQGRRPHGRLDAAPVHGAVRGEARAVLRMIFHSLDFVLFVLVVFTAYWRLPHRAQNRLLLVASYVFYGYIHPWFLGLILFSTTVDYWAARRMESDPARRRWYLIASIAANMGM